jgi:hypothetical protein
MPAMTVFQRNDRPPIVRDMQPGLTEVGKIKIGRKGKMIETAGGKKFQPPKKLDHFLITTLERDAEDNFVIDEAVHASLGEEEPTEIPVRLLFNDPWTNFQSRYVAYDGKSVWCTGDGHEATRRTRPRTTDRSTHKVACTCEHLQSDGPNPRCKINGRLSVILEMGNVVGGVWTFRTTSWNSVRQLQDSLRLLAFATNGQIAGVPLTLTLKPKQVTMADGRVNTIQVVGLEFRGSIQELRAEAERRASADVKYGRRIRSLENEAKLLMAPLDEEDAADVVEEFYPAEAVAQAERDTGQKVTILDEAEEEDRQEQAQQAQAPQPEPRQPRQPRQRQDRQKDRQPDPVEGNLVEVWDIYGEPSQLPGIEVEAWLEDQLKGVGSIEELNALVAANEDQWTAYLADKSGHLRAKLLAEERKAERENAPAPKKERVARGRAKPAPEEPAAPAAAAAEEEPAAGGGTVIIRWPTDDVPTSYPNAEAFVKAYQRRASFAGPGYAKLFRGVGVLNDSAWTRHIPAADQKAAL